MNRLLIALLGAGLLAASIAACSRAEPATETTPERPPALIAQPTPAADDEQEAPSALSDGDEEPRIPGLVAWWTRPDINAVLQLSDAEAREIGGHLRNLELSYQLAQTRLREARRAQTRMIEDVNIEGADILRFHREQLQTLSTEALELNIAARVWVRDRLSAEQKAAILERSPGFFRARWFRPARVNVREGEVRKSEP
jgi:hypothetical protein